jgi:hypothetical protein
MRNDALILGVTQAQELEKAFQKGGWTNEQIKMLSERTFLASVREALLGQAEIKPSRIIDCSADAPTLGSDIVKEHRRGGVFLWNPENVALYVTKEQEKGGVSAQIILKELEDKPVLNANVMFYLYDHPKLIPEKWKDKKLVFWGTIYLDYANRNHSYVCYLYWDGGRNCWKIGSDSFGVYCWYSNCPALISKAA